TDNNGRFDVRFTVPPDFVRIGISGNISGTWTVFHDSFSPMSRFEPTVSSADGWQFMISGVFPPDEVAWTADVTVAAVTGSSALWIAAVRSDPIASSLDRDPHPSPWASRCRASSPWA